MKNLSLTKKLSGGIALAAVLAAGSADAGSVTITQKGRSFSEREITVAPGDTIEFRNDDDTAHSVLSMTPGHEFDLKIQRPGEAKSISADKPGQIEVGCDIHPKMHLIINVR
jgi:plastocyanin